MGNCKYLAIIDCENLERVQRFESNDFILFESNMKLLEELLSQLKVTYTIYFNRAFCNEYLGKKIYEKNNQSEE